MNPRTSRSIGAVLASVAIGGALLATPAVASATVAPATANTAASCEITGGTLTWGVKESFRSYISGSIANGSWETSDGATYETPDFTWSDAKGSIDPATGTGTVSFTGAVHFTGHDGVLDLTIANPTIDFEGDGRAALMLDARSTDTTGEVVVDEDAQWVGDMTVPDPIAPSENALTLSDQGAVLTSEGAKAFAGFYQAGVDLDPINLDLQLSGCESTAVALTTTAPPETTAPTPETVAPGETPAAQPIPWLPIGIGAVALLVIGVTAGMLLSGRKRPQAAAGSTQDPASTAQTPEVPGSSEGPGAP